MISAKDLRVGNYFLDRGNKILRIDWFEHDKLCMENPIRVEPHEIFAPDGKMFGHPYTEDVEYANPIPLTEEILLKCGFELVGKQYEAQEFDVYKKGYFTWNSNHGWWFCHVNIENKAKIKHLHQLQNLYWCLCGEDLIINL